MSSMPDHEFEIHIAEGSTFTMNPLWFTSATRVTDLRTGKVIKNRSPDFRPCKVVLTLGPTRDEFFIVRDPTLKGPMKFNYGPMNATIKSFLGNYRSPAAPAPDEQALATAEKLAEKAKGLAALVEGKHVRVVRAVVYEGEGGAVLEQLSKSLPVGTTQITNRGGQGKYKITVSQGEIELVQPDPERIEVCRLDPDTLVGIAPCDDGSGTWVVMRQDGEGNAEPVGDDLGAIVYTDILDAAEVLRPGIVWKHDMGEDEATDDPDSGPLEDVTDPDSGLIDTVIPEIGLIPDRLCDEQGRIEYTVTYRRRETGEQVVTRFWSHPGRSRAYLIMATRHTVITTAAKMGRTLNWRDVERSIDPDSYTFDPPACGADDPVTDEP